MIDTEKKYNIFDTSGNCYKVDERNNLAAARNIDEAALFTFREASQRIGNGRRSHFYRILEADIFPPPSVPVLPESPVTRETTEPEAFRNPTRYDGLDNNWESLLADLCYLSDHMGDYQNNLRLMLSDVEMEICDILHCLEFSDLSDSNLLKVGRMLQDCRRRRREIKDEIEKTDLVKNSFLNKNFGSRVKQSLNSIKKMNERQYSPRRLNELFIQQQQSNEPPEAEAAVTE